MKPIRPVISGLCAPVILALLTACTTTSQVTAPPTASPASAPPPPPAVVTPIPEHSATTPAPRADNKGWMTRYERMNARAAAGNVDLVFIGDSITQGWEGNGREAWAEYYKNRNAMNLGIGGDRTQHVLWRIENGNMEGVHPRLAVIMIGTNNHKDNTAEEIADGVTAIVRRLREMRPEMKILLLAIFPRSENPDEWRAKVAEASELFSVLDDGENVFFMDIGARFLGPDNTIPKEIMPDFLHLSKDGYRIWAESIEPKVAELMGE